MVPDQRYEQPGKDQGERRGEPTEANGPHGRCRSSRRSQIRENDPDDCGNGTRGNEPTDQQKAVYAVPVERSVWPPTSSFTPFISVIANPQSEIIRFRLPLCQRYLVAIHHCTSR